MFMITSPVVTSTAWVVDGVGAADDVTEVVDPTVVVVVPLGDVPPEGPDDVDAVTDGVVDVGGGDVPLDEVASVFEVVGLPVVASVGMAVVVPSVGLLDVVVSATSVDVCFSVVIVVVPDI